MDDGLRERIRALAERSGLKPEVLEDSLLSGPMPDDLARAVAQVLAETGRFAAAPETSED
ncbi:MAG: hypothetical protein V3571_04060 [Pseudodesulfovibrio sp.]